VARRDYATEEITVHWDSTRCIHSAICTSSLPLVFDPDQRPWVNVTGAGVDDLVAAIERCPSGALAYTRADGVAERADVATTIVPWPNGPLRVRGTVEIRDRRGNLFRAEPRMALCRCGQSRNQPFCDMSHRSAGFRDHSQAVSDERESASAPTDLSPPPWPPPEEGG
jgi:uncharacterized Fe-S cluster protein YjdI/CDGSH-type Zn-finger protein